MNNINDTNNGSNSVQHLKSAFAQFTFLAVILSAISLKRISSISNLFNGEVSMSAVFVQALPFLVAVFCLALPAFIFLVLAVNAIVIIFREGKNIQITEEIVDDAPVAWIVPGFLGWLYLEGSGTQVGLIGRKVYKKSGIFFDLPSSPKRKKVISLRKIHYEIRTRTASRDNIIFTTHLVADCSVRRSNRVYGLVTEIESSVDYLRNELETTLTNFVQQNYSQTLCNIAEARRMLNELYREALPHFQVSVGSLILEGEHISDQDKLARAKDIFTITVLERRPDLLESTAEKLVEKYLATEQAKALAKGQEFTPDVNKLLQFVQSVGTDALENQVRESYTPQQNFSLEDQYPQTGELPVGNLQNDAFRSKLLEALSQSSFRLVQDKPFHYKAEYRGYLVELKTNREQMVSVRIYDPNGVVKNTATNWTKPLGELFAGLQRAIDRKR